MIQTKWMSVSVEIVDQDILFQNSRKTEKPTARTY